MKKLTAFILAAATLFSLCASIPASAQGTDIPPESIAQEMSEQGNDSGTGDASGTEEEKEQEYYYITQEEFEKYRDEYFEGLNFQDLLETMGGSFVLLLYSFAEPIIDLPYAFAPPLGPLLYPLVFLMPFIRIFEFSEVMILGPWVLILKDKFYNDFSTDDLYAEPTYTYGESEYYEDENGEWYYSELEVLDVKYTVKYVEAGEGIPYGCLPVAIKNS